MDGRSPVGGSKDAGWRDLGAVIKSRPRLGKLASDSQTASPPEVISLLRQLRPAKHQLCCQRTAMTGFSGILGQCAQDPAFLFERKAQLAPAPEIIINSGRE